MTLETDPLASSVPESAVNKGRWWPKILLILACLGLGFSYYISYFKNSESLHQHMTVSIPPVLKIKISPQTSAPEERPSLSKPAETSPIENSSISSPKEDTFNRMVQEFSQEAEDFILAQHGSKVLTDALYHSGTELKQWMMETLATLQKTKEAFPKEGALYTYRQPFTPSCPFIVLVLMGFGIESELLKLSLKDLPPEVTLGYYAAAPNLESQLEVSVQQGHETLVMVPLEPLYYPQNDPGENLLLTGLPAEENLRRLAEHLKSSKGVIGVVPFLGSRFTLSPIDMAPFLKELHHQGLMIFEAPVAPRSVLETLAFGIGLPMVRSELQIDSALVPEKIEAQLKKLEEQARQEGHAIGYGFASPLTLEIVKKWTQELKPGEVVLAPLSALISEQRQEK